MNIVFKEKWISYKMGSGGIEIITVDGKILRRPIKTSGIPQALLCLGDGSVNEPKTLNLAIVVDENTVMRFTVFEDNLLVKYLSDNGRVRSTEVYDFR